MIHTSLSPNAESDDVLLALKLLVTPWTWKNRAAVSKVENALGAKLAMPHVHAVDSGRTALFTILKALGIGESGAEKSVVGRGEKSGNKIDAAARDEVIIQAYTCVAVPEPILWAGARPVYVDCTNDLTLDLEDLQRKITLNTKAIVVQHTFGMPAPIREILAIARAKNIFVIEDCAHALLAEYEGRRLGTRGDASFFSFGRDKSISSVFGGAIATHSPALSMKIKKIVDSYPLPSGAWVFQQLCHPIILAAAKATYDFLSLGKIILEISKRFGLISKAVLPEELSGGRPAFTLHQLSPALAVLALNQLKKIERFAAHRQMCAKSYATLLSEKNITTPAFVHGHAYLRYTVFSSTRKAIMKNAKKWGIYLGDWYTTALAPVGVNYEAVGYIPGSCPVAERLASQSINLPTHIGISEKDIQKIIHVFD